MLGDSVVEVIGFDSCPEEKRLVSSNGSQTMDTNIKSNETQTAEMMSTGMQTVPKSNSRIGDDASVSYDVERLLIFLNRVLPNLEEELKDSASTDSDELSKNEMQESICNFDYVAESVESNSNKISIQSENFEDKMVSKLTWNLSGMTVGVAFSKSTHKGWCNHEASVCLYNTSKSKFDKLPPTRTLNTISCVTCIEFHPYIPSILAGGLYNGEVVVWDLTSDEEMLLTKIKGNEDTEFHTDAVTCLTWKEDRNGVKLVTAGRDGRIIIWRVTVGNLTFKTEERYLIPAESVPSASCSFVKCLEINCVGFWPGKESDFVVAASDKVIHCSSTSAKIVASSPNYKDPVFMNYKPHKGIATSLSCLSQSDVFASCGIDWEIHIYKSEMVIPLHIINTNYSVMGVLWTNSKCLASWGSSSAIECHKINFEPKIAVSTISYEVDENVSAVAFNLKRRGKVAVGSKGGILFLNDVAF